MADIRADTSKMKSGMENLEAYIDRMTNRLEELVQKKNELNAMWSGEASTAFKASFDEDISKLRVMVEKLEKAYRYEETAQQGYTRCENQVSGMISEL